MDELYNIFGIQNDITIDDVDIANSINNQSTDFDEENQFED